MAFDHFPDSVKCVYIAGPMAGYEDHNYPAFNAMEEKLRAAGYDVRNPATINADHPDREVCLHRDLLALLADCDAIQLLEGYEHSKGAALEITVAFGTGIPIYGPAGWQLTWLMHASPDSINSLASMCYTDSFKAGWWTDKDGTHLRENPLVFSNKLALIHSELSEALEGDRKGGQDKHIPKFTVVEAELADAFIRLCDLAGAYHLRLGEAVFAKRAYNRTRPDHKPEARAAAGGKKY